MGLSVEQVDLLKYDYGIYLVCSGCMCIVGLNLNNIDYVVELMVIVFKVVSFVEFVFV